MTRTLLVFMFASGCGDITVASTDQDVAKTQICEPSAARCDETGEVERCTADGAAFAFARQCASAFICDGGACVPREPCPAGETRCSVGNDASLRCIGGAWKVGVVCWGECQNGQCPKPE